MEINWITVGAQIVNFLILVWLLNRFLYGPITRAMAQREDDIRSRFAEADKRRSEAEAMAADFKRKEETFDAERQDLLAKANTEADALKRALLEEARSEVEGRRQAWRKQIADERADFMEDFKRRAAEHFYQLARAALGDLADGTLEEPMARRFIEKLEALDASMRQKLVRETTRSGGEVRLESAFELTPDAQARLTAAVRRIIVDDANVDFGRSDDVLCGLRLKAQGQTVEWSLNSYLDDLEARLEEALLDVEAVAEREAAE